MQLCMCNIQVITAIRTLFRPYLPALVGLSQISCSNSKSVDVSAVAHQLNVATVRNAPENKLSGRAEISPRQTHLSIVPNPASN
jgi:hypothetical protein